MIKTTIIQSTVSAQAQTGSIQTSSPEPILLSEVRCGKVKSRLLASTVIVTAVIVGYEDGTVVATTRLLNESGGNLLLENGDKLILG